MSDDLVTIPYSSLQLEPILIRGEEAIEKKNQEYEATVLGNLRGGTPGCIVKGEIVGGCHRAAIARAIGLSVPTDAQDRRFFEIGRVIEEVVEAYLKAGYQGPMLREEEAPVCWTVESGRKVTGRPDFLLIGDDRVGIELKTVANSNGATRLWFDRIPDPKHLVQAMMYMWQHNTPWILTYVSVAQYQLTVDAKKYGLPFGSKLKPFRSHFYLSLRDGVLHYRHSASDKDFATQFTIKGLRDYYELVDQCISTKQLYFVPKNLDALGNAMPWQHERYCEYCQAAEESSGDWDRWIDILTDKKQEVA